MSTVMIGVLGLVAFIVLVFLGIPITVSMAIAGVGGCMFLLKTPQSAFDMLSSSIFGSFTSYTTSVAPMFILMGELASETGIGNDLFDCFQVLTGHQKAGLAKATTVVCAIFGAICGSTAATSGMMSRVAHPQMMSYKYAPELSVGTIASSACLATLIPPSLHLITYGIAAESSIGALLIAGCSVGIVLMILFLITIMVITTANPSLAPDKAPRASIKEMWKAIRHGGFIEVILVFGLSMGGMFAGWFTPTEAGSVGFAGMFIVALLFKRFTFKALFKALKNTMTMTGMIYCMIAAARSVGSMFTYSRIPTVLANWVAGFDVPRTVIILLLTVIYFVLGCLIDGVAIILLTVPVFLPVIKSLGYSEVWFGTYIVVICGLGAVTPPVGSACFVVSGTSGVDLATTFKGCIPFWIAYVVCAILLAFIPGLATWLPGLMM